MSYVNGTSVIAIGFFFPVLGAATIALRFYIRRSRKISLGADDWLCLPALLFVTGCAISLIVGSVGHAVGYHSKPTATAGNDKRIVFMEKCEYAFNIMSPLALGFIKLSILFFYRRIFRGRTFDILSWTLIVLVLLWTVGFFLVQVFDCGTRFYINWGLLSDLQKCLSSFKQLLACSISDFVIDVFILVLPLPLIWSLHMPRKRKIAVCGIFLLGTIAIVASMLRMIIFAEILGAGHVQKVLRILGVIVLDDMTVVNLILFWPMVEMGVALVVASLPTLGPLFHDFSVESVVHSVRSKLSLESMRTPGSKTSDKEGLREFDNSTTGSTSKNVIIYACPQPENYLDTHIVAGIGAEREYRQPGMNQINVSKDMIQSVDHVV